MSRLVDLFDAQKGLLQFIDIFDIGSLLKIELAEKGICSLLASWDITLPLKGGAPRPPFSDIYSNRLGQIGLI